MKKFIIILAFIILGMVFIGCSVNRQSKLSTVKSDVAINGKLGPEVLKINEGLPKGWQSELIIENEIVGNLKGLEEAIAKINFINIQEKMASSKDRWFNPTLVLYFYNIKEKDRILEVIKVESIYSSNIPIFFDETKNYIILTSPLYVNAGHVKEGAELNQPLSKSLKTFFNKYK